MSRGADSTTLRLGDGPVFHTTDREVRDARLVDVPDSPVWVVLWDEAATDGRVFPFYALSPDGVEVVRVREAAHTLSLRYGRFDPKLAVPAVPATLAADSSCNLYIVQFVTQSLEDYRKALQALGASVYNFLPDQAHIVKMTPAVRAQVEALGIVRAVTPFHPAYRVEEYVRMNIDGGSGSLPALRYNIQVFEAGCTQKDIVDARIESIGGTVDVADAGKFLLQATLTSEQLLQVITWDQVSFVDRWGPYENDMDIARLISGADYIETVPIPGFTGTGVSGEVFDGGFNLGHPDFTPPLTKHGTVGFHRHGAATSGIVFGDGNVDARARGLLPGGNGIVADYNTVGITGPNRYTHTGELLLPPYEAVFQTASFGSVPPILDYTTISAEMDATLFDFDLLACQSQSNNGGNIIVGCLDPSQGCYCDAKNRCCTNPSISCDDVDTIHRLSRPQAWAKNVVSVGGIKHLDSIPRNDDYWCQQEGFCASTGPAADGRIKPDLAHIFENIYTVWDQDPEPYFEFFGTSGATPITCGYFGLLFQMWHEGVFPGFGGAATVFDSRPHMTTAKALMINTAYRYPFSQSDFSRHNQGWGMVDVQDLYDARNKIYIIDESYLLSNFLPPAMDFGAVVSQGEPALNVTLVYADPPGTVSSSRHTINDLNLTVTSPTGQVYWGNCGLRLGNLSAATCAGPNPPDPTDPQQKPILDTVENVFISSPAAGVWNIAVSAGEINQDSHVETSAVDADFALVVSGMTDLKGACCLLLGGCLDMTQAGCQQRGGLFDSFRTCATIGPCPSTE